MYHGIQPEVSDALQELFDYGTTQEINAIATMLGKVIPVYYPNITYIEDGCKVIPIGQSSAVVSGDGHGINEKDETVMSFEFKCPKPGKIRTTDTHYKLPTRYATQVLAEMNTHQCGEYAYLCYTPVSLRNS